MVLEIRALLCSLEFSYYLLITLQKAWNMIPLKKPEMHPFIDNVEF